MTDSSIRKEGVLEALTLLIKADSEVKKLSGSKFPFFQEIRDPDIAIMNLYWFFKHFNSIALKDPLTLAFNDLHEQYKYSTNSVFKDKYTFLYQLFCIAATLNSGRSSNTEKLLALFEEDGILTIPLFVLLFESGIEVLESENKQELKSKYNMKNRIKKHIKGIKFYLDNPSEDLRFTSLEMISSAKKVEIYTEGKTDASIIQHAFSVLTKNQESIWKVSSCETKLSTSSGGANQLAKLLLKLGESIKSEYDMEKTIIGIFDNDAKGNQEFNGLKSKGFDALSSRILKHSIKKIYAMKIPIPPYDQYNAYHQEKQEFRFFEIEHYFPLTILQEYNIVAETAIPGIHEIKDNKKTSFESDLLRISEPEVFKNFIYLFREIDSSA